MSASDVIEANIRLSAKQKKFFIEYALDGNLTAAAIRAGYSKTSAWTSATNNLKLPDGVKYMKHLENRMISSANIRREDIIDMLLVEARRKDDKATHAGNLGAIGLLARVLGLLSSDNTNEEDKQYYSFVMKTVGGAKIKEIANRPLPNTRKAAT